jgi:hypothetical protein
VAVPPLDQRVLHARVGGIALGAEQRHRHRHVVDDVQHGDGDDEGKVEPVGDVDVRFLAPQDGAEEDDEIGYPHDRQPKVHVPFRLGVFPRLGDAEEIAGRSEHDEDLVAPEHEPGEAAAEEAGASRALDHVEAGGDKRIATEGEDDGGRVERAQASEGGPGKVEVEHRIGKLQGNVDADEEARDSPEDGGDDTGLYDVVHVSVGPLAERDVPPGDVHGLEPPDHPDHRDDGDQPHMEGEERIVRFRRGDQRDKRDRPKDPGLEHLHVNVPPAGEKRFPAARSLRERSP